MMDVTQYPWAPALQLEASKYWFYALAISIVLLLYDLGVVALGRRAKGIVQNVETSSSLLKQLIMDGCDLLIPGSALGWLPASPLVVGIAMAVSSFLAIQRIWQDLEPV